MRLIDRGLEAILMEGGAAAGLSLAAGLAGVAVLGVVVPEFVEKLRALPVFNNHREHEAGRLRKIIANNGEPLGGGVYSSRHPTRAIWELTTRDEADLARRLAAAGIDRFPRNQDELAVAADALAQANDPLGEFLLVEKEPHILIGVSPPSGTSDMTIAYVQLANVPEAHVPTESPAEEGLVDSEDFMDSVQEAFDYAPAVPHLDWHLRRRYVMAGGDGPQLHSVILFGDEGWAERLFRRHASARPDAP